MKAVILVVLSGEELQRFYEILEFVHSHDVGLLGRDQKLLEDLMTTIREADASPVGLAVEYHAQNQN
jgi:hypothetical protein